MPRDLDHQYFMKRVLELAANCPTNEVPVAALVVDNTSQSIIGEACNARETRQSVLAHAEILAIEEATKYRKSWNLSNCSIYINLEPCAMCAGAIIQSHMSHVIFGAHDIKSGAFGSRYNISTKNLEILGGVQEEACLAGLQSFFKQFRGS